MVDAILRDTPVARTPVSPPRPGIKYEHSKHGLVRVERVEDDMVVFKRPGGSKKYGYINTRQQPLRQFCAQAVDIS